MGKVMCSLTNRCYTREYGNTYFFLLNDELEVDFFKSKHVPIVMVNINGKTMYYVEITDFLKAALPEINFTCVWLWKYDDVVNLRATVEKGHLNKHQLSILGSKCSDYSLDASEGIDEDGSPSGSTLDIVIPLQ